MATSRGAYGCDGRGALPMIYKRFMVPGSQLSCCTPLSESFKYAYFTKVS